jgi:hypothetical protein
LTIGWVIAQSNLSGVSEFLTADDDTGWSWSTVPKKATIFMDKEQVDVWFEAVQENPSNTVEIIPVEIHY